MKKIYFGRWGKGLVMMMIFCLVGGMSWGQTNNYFGTTGFLNGSVWSTLPGGPYISPLVTTGGAIINFGNTTTSISGASITVAGINATADASITTLGGTISNLANGIIPINVSSGITLDFNTQAITTSATAGFVKNGLGNFAFAGSTYGGGFTLNSGVLIARGNNTFGNASANLNGGVLAANNTRNFGGVPSFIMGGNIQIGEIPANVFLASNVANMTFPDISLGATTRTFTFGNAALYTTSGVISGSGGLTFAANANGAGTMTLTAVNTYSGPTSINGGTLSIGAINNGGADGRLGSSSNAATNLVLGGGTLSYTGGSSSTDRNFTLTTGTTSTINVSTAATTLTFTGASVSTNGSLTKTGTGTLQLDGSHGYTGTTAITAGTLRIGAAERIDNTSPLTLSGGTFDLNSFNETVGSLGGGSGSITSQIAGSLTFTAGGNNSSTLFAGVISNGSGTVAFTKEGTGNLTLTGANTFSGLTNVNAGTLQLNRVGGALATMQTINVNNSATLRISNNQTLLNVNLASGASLVVDAGVTLNITGTLSVNTGATISSTGTITYGGIGALLYNGASLFNAGIEWPTASVPVSVTIGSTATVVLTADVTTTNSLTVDGILNTKTFQVTGTGPTVNINGKLITERLQGFTGATTTFTGISPNLGLSSIVEYASPSGIQIITTSPLYINLTLSNGGTKTTSSALSISNNLTISNNTVFDADNSSIGGGTTNLVMTDNSRYITAGTGVKPDAGGTYSLARTSTIEFTNTAGGQQDIRLAPIYANIDVSGSNVGLSGFTSILAMQTFTTFQVTATGTFNVRSNIGFAGSNTTAINNINNPTILLQPGSTINYDGVNQIITNTVSYQNLQLSGTGTKTAPASTLSILGNLTKTTASTFAHNNGTVAIDGTLATTQTYSSVAPILEFNNLINNNTNGGLTIGSNLGVETMLTLNNNSKLLFAAGNIQLRSSAAKTAAVAQVATTTASNINYAGTGRFIVERYIPAGRKWRFLTSPVNSSQSVRQSWMENSVTAADNLAPGYGTIVTDNLSTAMANGFDGQSISGPSMKYYMAPAANFTGIINPSDIITSKQGYMTYIRGDRASTAANALLSSTILRSTGQLKTGLVSVNGVNALQNLTIGNPYPSQIDLRVVHAASSGMSPNYYVWDPKLTGNYGLGGYQTLALSGSDFIMTPGGGSYPTGPVFVNTIESGSAFLGYTSSAAASLNFNENAKLSGSNEVNFTGGNTANDMDASLQYFSSNLYLKNNAGVATIVDGTMVLFNQTDNNLVDYNDANKIANLNENVSVKRNNNLLALERRNIPTATDTIFLNTANLRVATYNWKINTQNINPDLETYLVDKFLQTNSLINAGTEYSLDFTVTNNAATYAADRFMIVFKTAPILPMSFTRLEANRMTNTKTVDIKFAVINSKHIVSYEVERSNNGTAFYKIAQNLSTANTVNEILYVNNDNQPLVFDNFYRIRAIYANGTVAYSTIIKVNAVINEESIVVFPNPVMNKSVSFEAIHLPLGEYQAEINTNEGKHLYVGSINVTANMQKITLELNNNTAAGSYYLIISSISSGKKYSSKIMVK